MNGKELMVNLQLAMERVGGDEELLQQVARLFLDDCPRALGEIRAAIDRGDAKLLEREAHSLKGSVANFGAEPVVNAALDLEVMGRLGNLAEAIQKYSALEDRVRLLEPELNRLAGD
ncbi:MAG: Hpt domain-containing protein [Acidobacteria bacterium]|nr:Hpt domain-containing protein [Acidobacteriota bacterium]